MGAKDKVRKLFNFLHLDITRNLKYDRLTQRIILEELGSNANCIDVGCHKGEILDTLLQASPQGKHFGFEPIPSFFKNLQESYKDRAQIFPYALSDEEGDTYFNFVKNAPAYSGIKERSYKTKSPEIEKIKVDKRTLDGVIPKGLDVDFIKIDVEGGEFDVLKGAQRILSDYHPLLIFEFGNGASEFYKADPADFFEFLTKKNYQIYTLDRFIGAKNELSKREFESAYSTGSDYYFVAKSK